MEFEILRHRVLPGQSWAAAADQYAASAGAAVSGPVLAADLSGDPLRFVVEDGFRFSVRQMVTGDLPDVVRWVNEPHVARWWDEDRSLAQVEAAYGPALRGQDPTRLWIWEVNGRSIGFGQDYRIADHPDYAVLCRRPEAVGFDYAIGEAAYVGRGLGTRLIWVFLRDIVWPAYPGCGEFFAAPDHRNATSLRLLDKLGFRRGLWFDEPAANGPGATVIGCSLDVAEVMGINASTP